MLRAPRYLVFLLFWYHFFCGFRPALQICALSDNLCTKAIVASCPFFRLKGEVGIMYFILVTNVYIHQHPYTGTSANPIDT